MEWRSLAWQAFFAACSALLLLFAARRSRSSMQRYADDLRRAARELSVQSEQLTSVEEAAKESKKESSRRTAELQTLRDRDSTLSASVTSVTAERDAARAEVARLHARLADLSTQLAKSDARRKTLEKEIAAARLVRLELMSKLRTDENERLSALNKLRHPSAAQPAMFLPDSPGATAASSERALSPFSVAKSPSESMLLSLHPDLELSDDDDEFDFRAADRTARELEERMEHKFPEADRIRPARSPIRVRRRLDVPVVELGKPAITPKAEKEGTAGGEAGERTATMSCCADTASDARPSNNAPSDTQKKVTDTQENAVKTHVRAADIVVAKFHGEEKPVEGLSLIPPEPVDTAETTGLSGRPQHTPSARPQETVLSGTTPSLDERFCELDETFSAPVDTAETIADVAGLPDDALSALRQEAADLNTVLPADEPVMAPASDWEALSNLVTVTKQPEALHGIPASTFEKLGVESAVVGETGEPHASQQVVAIKRETSGFRNGPWHEFDMEPLSLSRAPWIDTLDPVLLANGNVKSIASVLRPAFAEESAGIIPMRRRASWTSLTEGARANSGKDT